MSRIRAQELIENIILSQYQWSTEWPCLLRIDQGQGMMAYITSQGDQSGILGQPLIESTTVKELLLCKLITKLDTSTKHSSHPATNQLLVRSDHLSYSSQRPNCDQYDRLLLGATRKEWIVLLK